MMSILRLLAAIMALSLPPGASFGQSDPAGDWRGVMKLGPIELRVAMHLGAVSTFDSPDQGAFGLPSQFTRDGRKLTVTIDKVGTFAGEISEDGMTLSGVFTQGRTSTPVTFERGVFSAAKRPQTPVKPYPYREVEARYDNPARPGVRLAGALTLPPGAGPFPVVLLITGSGAQDRDETLFEHKPFLVLADHLTRRGVAVLRVDDRGAGASTGAGPDDTTSDYATDVAAGVAWLKARTDIDPKRIGLIGHSEGGIIAPMVAARDPSIAFVVLWAAPGVRGRDVVVEQVRALSLAAGVAPATADANAALQARLVDALMSGSDADAGRQAALKVAEELNLPTRVTAQLGTMTRPWYREFLAYDPAPALRTLKVPVLALLGGKDVQVVAGQNEPALKAALAANPKAEVIVLPGLNHLFQTASTGGADEYGKIEETVSPVALKTIGDWVVSRVL